MKLAAMNWMQLSLAVGETRALIDGRLGMKRLLPLLVLAVASPAALGNCSIVPPPLHIGGDSRDGHGLAWFSQPVCYRAEFVAAGLTLDAEARDALAQRLEGARRLYGTDCIVAMLGPERAGHEAGRLAYLRWWLRLQNVVLLDRGAASRRATERRGNVIALQLEPCSR